MVKEASRNILNAASEAGILRRFNFHELLYKINPPPVPEPVDTLNVWWLLWKGFLILIFIIILILAIIGKAAAKYQDTTTDADSVTNEVISELKSW